MAVRAKLPAASNLSEADVAGQTSGRSSFAPSYMFSTNIGKKMMTVNSRSRYAKGEEPIYQSKDKMQKAIAKA